MLLRRATIAAPLARTRAAAGATARSARLSALANARATGSSRSVLHAQTAVSWQTPRAMQFSSSPASNSSSDTHPTIFDGFEGLMQHYKRCSTRTSVFERYEREHVFPPSSARFSNFFLFTKLQLPPQTEIDAVEFLNGAQFACDLAMHTMYSREFINFACGAITESRAASHLQRGLSRECFDAFLFAMRESSKTGNTFDLKELEINGVYLVGVDWERLTLADYKAEQAVATSTDANTAESESESIRRTDGASSTVDDDLEPIAPSDYTTMVQRMRLDVQLETTEHLDVRTADGQDQTLARESSAIWRFESLVTTPDDIDWKIVSVI